MKETAHEKLAAVLAATPAVQFGALIGSRTSNTARDDSDWDIAVRWAIVDGQTRIAAHEVLRRQLASAMDVQDDDIDLVDLANAGLAMRAVVAEEGLLLQANDELAWLYFLSRTWRELEDFYWEQQHAA
ncbi:MAG TPA: nucleotidyltransferase domain-containing protein [Pseudomonadales bacterium]|nr:nucleotidyltransferase domain-containing protein [Pseudomonadales bacterium]